MADSLSFKPVTAEIEADFLALFGRGGPNYCWCMAFRATAVERKAVPKGADRKPLMLSRIAAGTPVGLIGYLDGKPVAWVSIAPRETFERLGGPQAQGGERIWSLTCLFIRRELRGAGRAHELIAAAVDEARRQKADLVEAYPVDPQSPSYRFMGFVPAFERAGFVHAGAAGSRRHVMRLTLSAMHRGNP